MTAGPASTMRRDIASAYLASLSKIGSWVIVLAIVYRWMGAPALAFLALVRGTVGLLNYVTLGLAPALIHRTATAETHITDVPAGQTSQNQKLDYRTPPRLVPTLEVVYANALFIAYTAGLIGFGLLILYARAFDRLYVPIPRLRAETWFVVAEMGLGTLLRLIGDVPGGILQVKSRISLDNVLIAIGEALWPILFAGIFFLAGSQIWGVLAALNTLASCYAVTGFIAFVLRLSWAQGITRISFPRFNSLSAPIMGQLLSFGAAVVLAQLADYLYAPTDYILINRLLNPVDVANYAPAVQIDAGLLLLVTGLAAVLLPKAALAHAGNDAKTVRQYYLRGTLASFVLLVVASTAVWLLSPWIFKLWLGDSMPVTRSILPIVLANTIIGGSSAVGRSILLAIGRAKPFTISVLIAGVTNVVCSYTFVRWLHWGLKGIVLGTVVAVLGRCAIWMPWYVLRVLKHETLPPMEVNISSEPLV